MGILVVNNRDVLGAHTDDRPLTRLPLYAPIISKEDLDTLRTYREYKKIREAAGCGPRRFDDKKGIRKDLVGEWLGPGSGDGLG